MPPKVMGEDTTHESDAVEALNVIEQAAIGVQVTAAATVQSAKRVQHTIEDVSTRMYEERDIKELSKGEAFAILGLGAKGDYAAILRVAGEIDKDAVESTALGDTEDGTEVRRRNRDRAIALLNHENADIRKETRRVLAERIAQRQRLYGENEHFMRLTAGYIARIELDLEPEDTEPVDDADNKSKVPAPIVETATPIAQHSESGTKLQERVKQVETLCAQLRKQLETLFGVEEPGLTTAEALLRKSLCQVALDTLNGETKGSEYEYDEGNKRLKILEYIVKHTSSTQELNKEWENLIKKPSVSHEYPLAVIIATSRYAIGQPIIDSDLAQQISDRPHELGFMNRYLEKFKLQAEAAAFNVALHIYNNRPKSIDHPDEMRIYLLKLFDRLFPHLTNQDKSMLEQAVQEINDTDLRSGGLVAQSIRATIYKERHDRNSNVAERVVGDYDAYSGTYHAVEDVCLQNSGDIEVIRHEILEEMKQRLIELKDTLTTTVEKLQEGLPRIIRNRKLLELIAELPNRVKEAYLALHKQDAPLTNADVSAIIAAGERIGLTPTDISYFQRYQGTLTYRERIVTTAKNNIGDLTSKDTAVRAQANETILSSFYKLTEDDTTTSYLSGLVRAIQAEKKFKD